MVISQSKTHTMDCGVDSKNIKKQWGMLTKIKKKFIYCTTSKTVSGQNEQKVLQEKQGLSANTN